MSVIGHLLDLIRSSRRNSPTEAFPDTEFSGVSVAEPVNNTPHGDTTVEMICERTDSQPQLPVLRPPLTVDPTSNTYGTGALFGWVSRFFGHSRPRSESYASDTTSKSSPSPESPSLSLHEEASSPEATNARGDGNKWVVIDLSDPSPSATPPVPSASDNSSESDSANGECGQSTRWPMNARTENQIIEAPLEFSGATSTETVDPAAITNAEDPENYPNSKERTPTVLPSADSPLVRSTPCAPAESEGCTKHSAQSIGGTSPSMSGKLVLATNSSDQTAVSELNLDSTSLSSPNDSIALAGSTEGCAEIATLPDTSPSATDQLEANTAECRIVTEALAQPDFCEPDKQPSNLEESLEETITDAAKYSKSSVDPMNNYVEEHSLNRPASSDCTAGKSDDSKSLSDHSENIANENIKSVSETHKTVLEAIENGGGNPKQETETESPTSLKKSKPYLGSSDSAWDVHYSSRPGIRQCISSGKSKRSPAKRKYHNVPSVRRRLFDSSDEEDATSDRPRPQNRLQDRPPPKKISVNTVGDYAVVAEDGGEDDQKSGSIDNNAENNRNADSLSKSKLTKNTVGGTPVDCSVPKAPRQTPPSYEIGRTASYSTNGTIEEIDSPELSPVKSQQEPEHADVTSAKVVEIPAEYAQPPKSSVRCKLFPERIRYEMGRAASFGSDLDEAENREGKAREPSPAFAIPTATPENLTHAPSIARTTTSRGLSFSMAGSSRAHEGHSVEPRHSKGTQRPRFLRFDLDENAENSRLAGSTDICSPERTHEERTLPQFPNNTVAEKDAYATPPTTRVRFEDTPPPRPPPRRSRPPIRRHRRKNRGSTQVRSPQDVSPSLARLSNDGIFGEVYLASGQRVSLSPRGTVQTRAQSQIPEPRNARGGEDSLSSRRPGVRARRQIPIPMRPSRMQRGIHSPGGPAAQRWNRTRRETAQDTTPHTERTPLRRLSSPRTARHVNQIPPEERTPRTGSLSSESPRDSIFGTVGIGNLDHRMEETEDHGLGFTIYQDGSDADSDVDRPPTPARTLADPLAPPPEPVRNLPVRERGLNLLEVTGNASQSKGASIAEGDGKGAGDANEGSETFAIVRALENSVATGLNITDRAGQRQLTRERTAEREEEHDLDAEGVQPIEQVDEETGPRMTDFQRVVRSAPNVIPFYTPAPGTVRTPDPEEEERIPEQWFARPPPPLLTRNDLLI